MEEEEALEIINGYAASSYESYDEIEQEIKNRYGQRIDSTRKNTRRASYAFVAGAGALYIADTYSVDIVRLAGFLCAAYGVTTSLRAGYHAKKAYSLRQRKQEIDEKGLDQVLEEEDPLEFVKDTLSN